MGGGAVLGGGDDVGGLTGITKPQFDDDEAVGAEAGGDGEGDAIEVDLEMGVFKPLAPPGDFAPGGAPGWDELGAEGGAGLGRGVNNHGS